MKTKHHVHPQKLDFQGYLENPPSTPGAYHRTIAMAGAKFSSPNDFIPVPSVPVLGGGVSNSLTEEGQEKKKKRTCSTPPKFLLHGK